MAWIMTELSKVASPAAHLCLGVGTSRDSSGPLIVTIVGRTGVETKRVPAPVEKPAEPAVVQEPKPDSPTAPDLFGHETPAAKSPKVKQDVLQLEPVARGRFEKIEPTIVEGEDLDVPTFLRLKLKKKPPL
ncbi:MAG: hypothetical protein ACKOAS_11135 [Verrucomicrobiota bacterium]